jgi:hypothetical protein
MTIIETKSMDSLYDEQMVIGGMFENINHLKAGCETLTEQDFGYVEHREIFRALRIACAEEEPARIPLVLKELKKKHIEIIDSGTTREYIYSTIARSEYASFEFYIEQVKNHSNKRRLLDLASQISKEALGNGDAPKIIACIREELNLIEKNKSTRDKFPILFLKQLESNPLINEPPPKQMLLEYATDEGKIVGFLPKGIVAMLVGAGGVGKTHLLSQLAISVATGTPWLGTFTTTGHCGNENMGNVFVGLGENQYDDICRVLYKAAKHLPDISGKDLISEASKRIAVFSFCGQQAAFIEGRKPSLYFRQLKLRLIEIAPEGGWSLIILDPVSRLLGADAETDNASATQFIALVEELTLDLPGNPTVLFAHHVNKQALQPGVSQTQSAARGASALTDGVRWQCNLAKEEDKGAPQKLAILKMTKSNFTAILDEIKLSKDCDGRLVKESSEVNNLFG